MATTAVANPEAPARACRVVSMPIEATRQWWQWRADGGLTILEGPGLRVHFAQHQKAVGRPRIDGPGVGVRQLQRALGQFGVPLLAVRLRVGDRIIEPQPVGSERIVPLSVLDESSGRAGRAASVEWAAVEMPSGHRLECAFTKSVAAIPRCKRLPSVHDLAYIAVRLLHPMPAAEAGALAAFLGGAYPLPFET